MSETLHPRLKLVKFFVPIVFDLVRDFLEKIIKGSIYDKNCYYYLFIYEYNIQMYVKEIGCNFII
jgi:hypothetical protein